MLQRNNLGEFEEIVMLTIGVLNQEAYGLAIKRDMEERLHRRVSMGALHTALYRLEEKGFLHSWLGEATKVRGGKPKRFFQVTALGQQTLTQVMNTRQKLWDSIPKGAFELYPSK